jgi:hypothetical protein
MCAPTLIIRTLYFAVSPDEVVQTGCTRACAQGKLYGSVNSQVAMRKSAQSALGIVRNVCPDTCNKEVVLYRRSGAGCRSCSGAHVRMKIHAKEAVWGMPRCITGVFIAFRQVQIFDVIHWEGASTLSVSIIWEMRLQSVDEIPLLKINSPSEINLTKSCRNAIKTPVIHLGIPRTASFAWIFMRTCARRNSFYNLPRTDGKVQPLYYKCRDTYKISYPEHTRHCFLLPFLDLQSPTSRCVHMLASNQNVQPAPAWRQCTLP